jgi:hypothetical protein
VACSFADGVDLSAWFDNGGLRDDPGVFVVLTGEISVQVMDDINGLASAVKRLKQTMPSHLQLVKSKSRWSSITTHGATTWRVSPS